MNLFKRRSKIFLPKGSEEAEPFFDREHEEIQQAQSTAFKVYLSSTVRVLG
jgi:hypothetical protein